MRALLRPWLLGSGASIALAAAIIIFTRPDIGIQRFTLGLAAPAAPAHAAEAAPRNNSSATETRQLSESLKVLAAERNQLLSRIASLERNLGEVTNAIKTPPAQASLATQRETPPEEPSSPAIKFAVDLGAAASMEAMRAQWAVAKANHGALFEGLRPIVAVHESKPGTSELRLIVGPLTDIAAASKLCAALAALNTYCRAAIFDGQRLAHATPQDEHARPQTAAACPGNPDALGVSRVLKVSADEFAQLGTMQYQHSLPLADHEVVLTFDDGPLPPYTDRVLGTLAAECVKATYFLVGRQANANPALVRKIHQSGHTIGTHSQHHPYTFARMSSAGIAREIDSGFVSVANALGDPAAVAPFFRFPGLMRTDSAESYLASRAIVTWSADLDADDWHRHLGANEVLRRAVSRLEAKGRGVMLLHDIQPSTVQMLPALLRELRKRGYRIVHVVPGGVEPLKQLPMASAAETKPEKQAWPRVAVAAR